MFCANCGSKAVEGDRFCGACGHGLRIPSGLEPVVVPSLEGPEMPAQSSSAAVVRASTTPVGLTTPMAFRVREGTQGSADLSLGEFSSPKVGKAKKSYSGSGYPRRLLVLFAAGAALAVVGVLGGVLSKTGAGMPPADPVQALHRLKDVANIDLPIDDGAVATGLVLVPLDMPQRPSFVGQYFGSVWMESGGTVELRVSAYALAADAAQNALWWNTSGVKEYYNGFTAVQCGRIVIEGAWVTRHTRDDTVKLLHQAYPDCTPYIPEKAPAPSTAPAPELAPRVEETPTPTRIPPPAVDGFVPRDAPVAASSIVAGAFVITDLVISNKDPNNKTVTFTVKNTSKQVVNLLPQVYVQEGTDYAMWGGEQGSGVFCHTLGPNASERITIGDGQLGVFAGAVSGFPTNWTSAVVTNGPQGC